MTGLQHIARPADLGRIDLDRNDELRYWMLSLGCGEVELLVAVHAVGTDSERVRDHLDRRNRDVTRIRASSLGR